jgi:hypothetical protein
MGDSYSADISRIPRLVIAIVSRLTGPRQSVLPAEDLQRDMHRQGIEKQRLDVNPIWLMDDICVLWDDPNRSISG